MVKVEYSRRFFKSFEKLPASIQKKAERKDKIFRQDPFSPSLKTHKLKGELKKLLVVFDR
jgi:mRNA-degrading endonuclease YafQ of YafQ-DinJ toxin-antitoxin module